MRIAKVTELCRLEDKANFIFVIKELLGSRTNKAGAILVYFNGKRQTLGTKAMATSQMEKQIEIRLKDISKGTEEEIYRDKLVGIPLSQINRISGGHFCGILTKKPLTILCSCSSIFEKSTLKSRVFTLMVLPLILYSLSGIIASSVFA